MDSKRRGAALTVVHVTQRRAFVWTATLRLQSRRAAFRVWRVTPLVNPASILSAGGASWARSPAHSTTATRRDARWRPAMPAMSRAHASSATVSSIRIPAAGEKSPVVGVSGREKARSVCSATGRATRLSKGCRADGQVRQSLHPVGLCPRPVARGRGPRQRRPAAAARRPRTRGAAAPTTRPTRGGETAEKGS